MNWQARPNGQMASAMANPSMKAGTAGRPARGPVTNCCAAGCCLALGEPMGGLGALQGLSAAAAGLWVDCLAPACTHAQLPAQPWCACCAGLGGKCWALALRLLAVWLPGCCVGPVGACVVPPPGTTSCPALAGHAVGSRLGALGGGEPALLGASSWPPGRCRLSLLLPGAGGGA
ncbi:hypothetical protein HaLaN_05886 [Haematococcus lacustris]|uniref:Uncharacterized protein n=1 Tax=Haematococcus lacustris TaxID=44745 RepID=A0A699YMM3_HAELA|nr:hypothetical protein HaLaN_05886 [Haematococcus lacustris]